MLGQKLAWLGAVAIITTNAEAQTRYLIKDDSVTVVADSSFRRGGLGQWLLGRTYRDLWNTPVRVAVIDPDKFAGGLTPVERGGGLQTKSLRLKGANGKEYQFRLVRKDPAQVVGEELDGTIVGEMVRDQMSAIHPGGSLIAPPLLKAAGVLHASPTLGFMPDHPRLGEFRNEFGNQLGTIEERPDEGSEGKRGFAGAIRVEDTDGMLKALQENPTARVNSESYLKARLIDFLIGDWDRHEDQYRWALVGSGGRQRWEPIPRDRDQAFVRYDGALLGVARLVVPKLIVYDENYPSASAATYNGRHLDRRILNDMEWAAWDSLTREVQSHLTDKVIDDAVKELPPEYGKQNGATLRRVLKARRDRLPDMSRQFYEYLSGQVMIDAGHIDDQVVINRSPDGATDIQISRVGQKTPYFKRTFRPDETREIRIYLLDGADRVRVQGTGNGPKVRLVGGKGSDTVTSPSGVNGVELYDADTSTAATAVPLDPKPYVSPNEQDEDLPIQQDWGGTTVPEPEVHLTAYTGLAIGMGIKRIGYGFRRHPYASMYSGSLVYSFKREAFRVELGGRWRKVNREMYFGVDLKASGIEGGRFFGFGDTTVQIGPSDRYLAVRDVYELSPYIGFGLEQKARLWLMLKARQTITDMSDPFNATSAINQLQPAGTRDVGQLGPAVRFTFDSRDTRVFATRGVYAKLEGDYFPISWTGDVGASGSVEGSIATYLSPAFAPDRITLALRAGGRQAFGDYPYFEAAYLGGKSTLRGYSKDRFAGDRSLYGIGELRLKVLNGRVLLPTEIGLLGMADIGRVWYQDAPGSWRNSFGGGLWIAALNRGQALTLGIAKGDQGSPRFWFTLGAPF